ncbi:DUF4489 domain-containing protein [Clostridium botulinum]|uniref:DUF4489 domain-containing protein n=1 Tax=Clostridium botulinum (strain Eklund 17B / Type B) TaxID=935198 RepID=B2TRV7_CLOBB|nr:hypothetical protein CLL_A2342 [Clostridium botulinum B str. Eklund 17B (NRP)]MBN1055763.1 DUF4489 domain-containing protein [Clostridium botulinum]MBY6975862.1 DUF4489 domain-containing protein [Clostridium botulinum]MBY7000285.1 DUF4489 domain-containing protein [Clostridium botulinum]NFD70150.1 DUF4489 domain-containing protein [Clostridium botulinum]
MNSLKNKDTNINCTSLAKDNLSDCCCICNSNKIILNCGDPVSSMVQLPLVPGVPGIPITVAKVVVNTSCLHDPQIKLEFVMNIDIPANVTITNLTFQAFKFCNNMCKKTPVGPPWSFKNKFMAETNAIFSFFVYDYDTFESKCCTYIVEATPYS